MTGVVKVSLGELVTDAKSGFACGEDDPEGVFQIRMNNITRTGHLDLSRRRRVPKAMPAIQDCLLQKGDVLFNATNSPDMVGKTAVVSELEEPTVFSNHFIRLRVDKQKTSPQYLARWLHYQFELGVFRALCRQWVNQATVPRDSLLSLGVPVLPLVEQTRAAEVLDQVDALRAKRRETLACLDELGHAIFHEMFSDPHGHETRPVGHLAEVQGGLQVTAARRGLPLDVPYLRVANVYRNHLDLSEIKTIRATQAEVERTRLQAGDVLVVEGHGNRNEIGRAAVWDGSLSECVHQNHLIRIRFREDVIVPAFGGRYLNSQMGRRHLLHAARTTSGLNTISVSDVRSVPMVVPSLAEQRKFAARLAHINALADLATGQLERMNRLFDALQAKVFRHV